MCFYRSQASLFALLEVGRYFFGSTQCFMCYRYVMCDESELSDDFEIDV